jgi:hypothetical protein
MSYILPDLEWEEVQKIFIKGKKVYCPTLENKRKFFVVSSNEVNIALNTVELS